MNRIGVIAATYREVSSLIAACNAERLRLKSPWDLYGASMTRKEILFVIAGAGMANAAAATVELLHVFQPDLVVATGCAGAYPGSGLAIGDLAAATSEVFADTGVATPGEWLSLERMGLPLLDRNGAFRFNEIPLSRVLTEQAADFAREMGQTLRQGRFLTVSTCSGTLMRGEALCSRFNGICENMEGAAVALVADRYDVECLEIRGISNHVEDRDISRWDVTLAVENSRIFLDRFLRML
jgi:futalosine hydrolase